MAVDCTSICMQTADSYTLTHQTTGSHPKPCLGVLIWLFQEGEKYPTFSLTFPACVRTFEEISEQLFPDQDADEPDVSRSAEIARAIQERMLNEMEEVWPKNFYTGYVASMCDIREKELLFLTDSAKRNRTVKEFKTAVLECCNRQAARSRAVAANAIPASESNQQASVPEAEQKAQAAAPAQVRDQQQPPAAGKDQQLFNFNPLKPRKGEQEFKERLMKQRAEEDKASEAHMNDPVVKLEREVDEEVARYVRVGQQESADPLLWWCEHRQEYPRVAQLARTMLAIPASSAGAERVFKSLSLALSKRRRRLHDHHAENMVFIHENREFFAPEIWALEQQRHKAKEQRKAKEAGDPDPHADD